MKNEKLQKSVMRSFSVPITIEAKTIIVDEHKVQRENWKAMYRIFAAVQNLHGVEHVIAAQTGTEKTVKFTVKAGIEIDDSMRIRMGKRLFEIEFIDNIRYENTLLEIRARERVVKR